ncbi:MAG: hypothetical protein OEY01_11805, partial [Desulfobulbaceae bacterium]|nr:hypothetical protein [Desulfobulbaceae bacterium]HIJ79490.1 hypothetical protein [Deltaproteobacteria bacterium]
MVKSAERIKKSILIPLGGVLFILFAITVFSAQRWIGQQFEYEMREAILDAQRTYSVALDKDAEVMLGMLDFLKKDESLQQAWLAKDRGLLLQQALPIFKELKPKYRVTHFYFHGLDKVNFLRVHNPPRHGDFIKRFTLKTAAETEKTSWGIELGPLGTFTLRVVVPWYINGSLSGYLELGEEISHITGQMKETLGIEIMSVIDKKFLNRAKWEEGMGMIGVSANWNLFDDFVVSEQTLSHIPRKLIEALGEHQQDHSLRLFDAIIDGRVYSAGIVPLRDVSGQEVGEFVVLQDFEHKKSLMQRLS